MRSIITQLDPSYPIVNEESRTPTDQFRIFMLQSHLGSLLIGTGTPEGFVEAQQGRFYMDDTGPVGAVLYIKQSADLLGDRTKGWVLI